MLSLWKEEAIWSRASARGVRRWLAATQAVSFLVLFCPTLVRPPPRSAWAKRHFSRPGCRRGSLLRGAPAARVPAGIALAGVRPLRFGSGIERRLQVGWRRRSWLVGRGSRAKVVLRTQVAGSTLQARALANTAMELTPAVNPTYTVRRPDAKPPRPARSSDGRRLAGVADQKLRAASCMRLLDGRLGAERAQSLPSAAEL